MLNYGKFCLVSLEPAIFVKYALNLNEKRFEIFLIFFIDLLAVFAKFYD